MKKLWIIGAAVVIIAGAAVAVLVTKGSDDDTGKNNTAQTSAETNKKAAKDACAWLPEDMAVKILGEDVEAGAASPGASSDDVTVSSCTYTTKAGETLESVRNIRSLSVLVRAPLTKTGEESNHMPFHDLKPGQVNVTTLGEMAFWDPEMGQMNVLKDHTWFILSNGKSKPADRTQQDAETMATTMGLSNNVY